MFLKCLRIVKIENIEKNDTKLFDLEEGTYSYEVSASGYITEDGTFTVSSDDVAKILGILVKQTGVSATNVKISSV